VNFVKNFEASTHKFPEKVVDKVRSMFVNSIGRNLSNNYHVKYFDNYINKEVNKCKSFLKNNSDLLITKADKGQITVIIDKKTYMEKMFIMLGDTETYRPIKTNPLSKVNSRLNGLIKGWLDSKVIDDLTYRSLKCSNDNLPRCYGLPKIKKMYLFEL